MCRCKYLPNEYLHPDFKKCHETHLNLFGFVFRRLTKLG